MKDMTTTRSLLAAMAAIVLTLALSPGAWARSGDPAMNAGPGILNQNVNQATGVQRVWYAGKPWYVIGYDGTGNTVAATSSAVTLLYGDSTNHTTAFGTNDEYGTSMLKTFLENIYNGAGSPPYQFTAGERAAVQSRTLEGGSANYGAIGYDW